MEVLEVMYEASTAFIEKKYDIASHKYKRVLQLLSRLNVDNVDSDHFVIQYVLCISLLESNTLQDILQALETLIKLKRNSGNSFPAIYYAMGKAYIKLYRFNAALDEINKGLAILKEGISFQTFKVPMTSIVIEQSTKEGFLIALMNLRDEALSWHVPDARCYMRNCQHLVPNCEPCRDIYFSDPAFTGLIVIMCSHPSNPCKFKFHPVCWNVYKEELNMVIKLTDKEIIGSPCFTTNCEYNKNLSIITKIEVYDNKAQITSTIENFIPPQHHPQSTSNSSVQGAIRKYTPKPFPKLRRPNSPCNASSKEICNEEKPLKEEFDIETRLAKLIKLRESNFNIPDEENLDLNKDKCDTNRLDLTTDDLPDFPSKDNDAETIQQSRFLFEILYEFIKSNAMVHISKVLSQWHETKRIMECTKEIDEYLDCEVTDFLLKSPKLIRVGNYICVPETLRQTLQIFEHDIVQQGKFLLEIKIHEVNCDSEPTVDNVTLHEEVVNNFEDQTDQNSGTYISSDNFTESNISHEGQKDNLTQCKDTFNRNNFFITHTLPLNGNVQISDKDKYCNNDKDMKRNIQNFFEPTMDTSKIQNGIKHISLQENMSKDIPDKDNSTKQLESDKLLSAFIALQEKHNQLMTNYSMMEKNMTKLIKEKADMEQNFKSELNEKNSIIEEDKIIINKLQTIESCIAQNIPVENETLYKIITVLKSEISRLKQESVDNEYKILLLMEEKQVVEDTLNKEIAQLLETVKHYQVKIDKQNAQLIILEENDWKLKKCTLEKSLESQFLQNKCLLLQCIKQCQVAVDILSNLNYTIHRHTGLDIVPSCNVWLDTLDEFQAEFLKFEEEYWRLKPLLELKAEVEKMDTIVMTPINMPPYPGKPLFTSICDIFMTFYMKMTNVPQHSLSLVPSVTCCPILPNNNNLPQLCSENKPPNIDNSPNIITNVKHEAEQTYIKDKNQNIIEKPDSNKEDIKDAQINSEHTNISKKVQLNSKYNGNDLENKIEEYIKDDQIVTEEKTNRDSPIDINNDAVLKAFNENNSVSKSNDIPNNAECKLVLKSKVEKTIRKEIEENASKETDKILINSTDKLMNILRNKYTGISELSLLKSLDDVRKQYNGSLSGISLNTIIHEVDKYILLRQINYLCTYPEATKTTNSTTTTTARMENNKQSKTKAKKKSSSSSNNSMKTKPFKSLTCPSSSKTPVQNQKGRQVSIPASSGAIKKVPVQSKKCPWDIIVKPGTNKNSYNEAECVICMENLKAVNKLVYTLDCQHKFHKTCIKDWFQQNQSCPTCRIHCTIDEEYPPLP